MLLGEQYQLYVKFESYKETIHVQRYGYIEDLVHDRHRPWLRLREKGKEGSGVAGRQVRDTSRALCFVGAAHN